MRCSPPLRACPPLSVLSPSRPLFGPPLSRSLCVSHYLCPLLSLIQQLTSFPDTLSPPKSTTSGPPQPADSPPSPNNQTSPPPKKKPSPRSASSHIRPPRPGQSGAGRGVSGRRANARCSVCDTQQGGGRQLRRLPGKRRAGRPGGERGPRRPRVGGAVGPAPRRSARALPCAAKVEVGGG